ncbi:MULTISPECIES: M15 family metallopeptidase [unclassified Pseudoalteromonas]|uniref:M15 family metallopeptidase n=1 Tax=unclassified Pseudoalteromonas TaxID=194690 RepID=UPI0020969F47|nr:M15 family metallopeptidase [Pseudoalteromonas sp. XMcav2-N]MCO7188445.1 M15 family metallopeptidase [Pseudoalteromonas sp. XMcav2-N]
MNHLSTLASQACGLSTSHLISYANVFIHSAIQRDLLALSKAAKQAGFTFSIASAHRDFHRQCLIWNNKAQGLRPVLNSQNEPVDLSLLTPQARVHAIMLYSALPGASRHHFGTDLDVYASNCLPADKKLQLEPWEYEQGGPFAEFNGWMSEHLAEFGFFRPYQRYQGGVAAEPWHISHRLSAAGMMEALSVETLATVIRSHEVAARPTILEMLPTLYTQYIDNICE